jgi:primosomal protein N'
MDLELRARHQAGYPPFTRLVRIVVESRRDESAEALGKAMRLALARAARGAKFTLLGPAPAPIRRIKGWSRWHLLVKCGTQESFAAARDAIVGSGVRSQRSASEAPPGNVAPRPRDSHWPWSTKPPVVRVGKPRSASQPDG